MPFSENLFSENPFSENPLCENPLCEKKISPETLACNGSKRMIASEVIDFPEPDSPTKPKTSPAAIVKTHIAHRAKKCGDSRPRLSSARARRKFDV